MILITSYLNPDLDGVACSMGMEELLRSQGCDAWGVIFGSPSQEAGWVLKTYAIPRLPDGHTFLAPDIEIILVDASDTLDLEKTFPISSVVEIIDHRAVHHAQDFPNVRTSQIELVGSCATLVAERMQAAKAIPSQNAARLLYGAIISNTVNFKSPQTTMRDRDMSDWLLSIAKLPDSFIADMFKAKSDLSGNKLSEALTGDYTVKEFAGRRIGFFALEADGVETVLRNRRNEIMDVMRSVSSREQFDYLILNAIDIFTGESILFAFDEASRTLCETALGRVFKDNVSKIPTLLMRKQITPKLKEYLEGETEL